MFVCDFSGFILFGVVVFLASSLLATAIAFACYCRSKRRIILRTGEVTAGTPGSRPPPGLPRLKPPPIPRSPQAPSPLRPPTSPSHSAPANSDQNTRHPKSASRRHKSHGTHADCHALEVPSELREPPRGLHSDSKSLPLQSPELEVHFPYLNKSSNHQKASLVETKQSSRNGYVSGLRSEHSAEGSAKVKPNLDMKFRKDTSAAGKVQMKSDFSMELAAKMSERTFASKHRNITKDYSCNPSFKSGMEQRRSFSDQEPDYASLDEDSEGNCGSDSATLQRPPGGRAGEQQQLDGVQYMNVTGVSGLYMNVISNDLLAKGCGPELHKAVSDPEHLYESLGEDEPGAWRPGNATWQGIIGTQTLRKMGKLPGGNWRSMERDSHPYASPCSTDDEDPYEDIN
ncbi:hypothetical protein C7M84_020286 [Penaeus vannamei]|uniref:Uncharacterized protein n=1 Tax=Penaeus vannamei TaxID=6689 RepID=A0A3R7MLX3_PENVA|nr:hypothetical protein C7M84_020286 [Penaeus vannamei]